MSQGNCTAKSFLVNGWSWIQLCTICLFSALRWFSSSYLKPALQWNQLLNKRLCYFLFIGSSICPLLPPLPVDPMLSMSTPTLPLLLPPPLHSMPTPLIKNPTSIIAHGIPPIPTRRSYWKKLDNGNILFGLLSQGSRAKTGTTQWISVPTVTKLL